MSQLFVSGGQSIGALASASVLPLGLTGLTSLLFTGAAYTLRKTVLYGDRYVPKIAGISWMSLRILPITAIKVEVAVLNACKNSQA